MHVRVVVCVCWRMHSAVYSLAALYHDSTVGWLDTGIGNRNTLVRRRMALSIANSDDCSCRLHGDMVTASR